MRLVTFLVILLYNLFNFALIILTLQNKWFELNGILAFDEWRNNSRIEEVGVRFLLDKSEPSLYKTELDLGNGMVKLTGRSADKGFNTENVQIFTVQ